MKKSGQIEYDEGIERIIEIGKSEICNINDLHYFLPDFPNLMGREVIFSNFKFSKFFLNNIEYIIKGLHYIELEYRKRIGDEFGFGSPVRRVI